MHGCGVIICMIARDFYAKLVNPGIMLKSQRQGKKTEQAETSWLVSAQGDGSYAATHIGPKGWRGSRAAGLGAEAGP